MSQPQGGDKEQKVLALNPECAKVPENKFYSLTSFPLFRTVFLEIIRSVTSPKTEQICGQAKD